MSPITHLFIGWSVATTCNLSKRDRLLVTLAGVVPDVDGAGILFDFFRQGAGSSFELWGKYHHVVGHTIGFGMFLILMSLIFSTRRYITAVLVCVSFHCHLIGDLVGSKGPDGYQWPIPYLQPFSDTWQLAWSFQWQLNSWPNFLITLALLAYTFHTAWKQGISPVEMVSERVNSAYVNSLRNRFGQPEMNRNN